jgi:hypothetical protein
MYRFTRFLSFALLCLLSWESAAQDRMYFDQFKRISDELHDWERSVRGFRRDHNFAMTGGLSRNIWSYQNDGKTVQVNTDSPFVQFDYGFHLQLYRALGYYLGSAASFHNGEDGKISTFRSYSFPGLKLGLVLNPHPLLRLSAGMALNLGRIERLSYVNPASDADFMSVNTRMVGINFAVDIFYKLAWAIRGEFESRTMYYRGINDQRENSPFSVDLGKNETRIGIGLVYHLI